MSQTWTLNALPAFDSSSRKVDLQLQQIRLGYDNATPGYKSVRILLQRANVLVELNALMRIWRRILPTI